MPAKIETEYSVWCEDHEPAKFIGSFESHGEAEEARDGHNAERHPGSVGPFRWHPPFPDGTLSLTLEDGRIRIDRADPVVAFSRELIDDIRRGGHPDVSLLHGHPDVSLLPEGDGNEEVLRISGINRTVAYKVTDYLPVHGFYVLELVEEESDEPVPTRDEA